MSVPRFDLAVVVLGMHRSGTSALTGVLGQCGLTMPRTLLAPSDVNERGFWESEAVKLLNDEVFQLLGMSWHSLAEVPSQAFEERRFRSMQRRGEEVVAEEFSAGTSPVIKDPRICRLLPFWQPVLAKLSRRAAYPIVVRNPLEVAQSLSRRNDFELEFGLLLWVRHYLDAEFMTRGRERAVVSYANLLEDPQAAVKSLGDRLNLPLDLSALRSSEAVEFLSNDLRHHSASDADLLPHLNSLPILGDVWRILRTWSEGATEGESDHRLFDEARLHLDQTSGMFSRLVERSRLERKRRATAKAETDKISAQLGRADQALQDIGKLKLELEAAAQAFSARQDERFDSLRKELSAALAALRASVEDRARLEANLSEALAGQNSLRIALEQEREQFTKAQAQAEAAARMAANKTAEVEDRLATEQGKLAAEQGKLEEAHAELERVKRKYRSTQVILGREEDQHRQTKRRLEASRRAVDELHQSIGWRTQARLQDWGRRIANISSFGTAKRQRRREDLALVRSSEFFDAQYYLSKYPDVAQAKIDPAEHYLDLGWREGRSPSAAFSSSRYLKMHCDVATMGINPLLHYLQHGQFEGRDIRGAGPASPPPLATVGPMGPAAPCASFELPQELQNRWIRACNLPADERRSIMIDGLAIALAEDPKSRSEFDEVLTDLVNFSGFGPSGEMGMKAPFIGVPPIMNDAWFVTTSRLRSRWEVESPTVLRALQCDPTNDGRVTLVGEGVAATRLEVIDFDLANPLFPLLIVATTAEGRLISAWSLAFPSLCRGGLHYPETIDLAGPSKPSVAEISARLGLDLRAIQAGTAKPLLKTIAVELAGSDGTGPLFQSAVREWLLRLARVVVEPVGSIDSIGEEYLSKAVSLAPGDRGRPAGATLTIAGDMIPAISGIVAHAVDSKVSREIAMALILTEEDPSQPATRLDPPSGKISSANLGSRTYPPTFPKLKGRGAKPGLGAIRSVRRQLTEAELLIPDMELAGNEFAPVQPLSWLVSNDSSNPAALREMLDSLALQDGSSQFRLLFLGDPTEAVRTAAERLFPGRAAFHSDIDRALAAIETAFVGYIAAGVQLHDPRVSNVLQKLLGDDDSISSASCGLVSTQQRGKDWKVEPVDVGLIPVDRSVVRGPATRDEALLLWRSPSFPVVQPPRDLWLARHDALLRWRAGEAGPKETHLVTTLVSASAPSQPGDHPPVLEPMPAAKPRALRAKVLVG